MAKENRVLLEMDGRPENVAVARVLVATVAAQHGFTVAEIEEIRVAVSEAVSNAVIHAYGTALGVVRLEVAARDGELEVAVADRGRGIADLELARQAAFSTDPERMGLGFVFMENFMDQVEVETAPGQGTRVRMRKRAESWGPELGPVSATGC